MSNCSPTIKEWKEWRRGNILGDTATVLPLWSGGKWTLDLAGWIGRVSAMRSHIDLILCLRATGKGKVPEQESDLV